MAGCMIFVFAALGEFVVVKVLDVQYQYQINRIPKVLPMVNVWLLFLLLVFLTANYIESTLDLFLSVSFIGCFYLQRISAMEKGQCPTLATWDGGNVRSRKATPTTATTPGQVKRDKKNNTDHSLSYCVRFFLPLYLNHIWLLPRFSCFHFRFCLFSFPNLPFGSTTSSIIILHIFFCVHIKIPRKYWIQNHKCLMSSWRRGKKPPSTWNTVDLVNYEIEMQLFANIGLYCFGADETNKQTRLPPCRLVAATVAAIVVDTITTAAAAAAAAHNAFRMAWFGGGRHAYHA